MKEEEGVVEVLLPPQLLLWVVATILHIFVQIVSRAIGAMEIAIGLMINVCLYNKVLASVIADWLSDYV